MPGAGRDWFFSRVIDLVLSFPQTLMLLALSAVLLDAMHDVLHFPAGTPSSIAFLMIFLSVFGWPFFARIIRGQVLSLREREFIEAAKSLGASPASTSRNCCPTCGRRSWSTRR